MRVTINGTAVDAPAGALLLDVLADHGVEVPHLCHDPRLAPSASCRLCEVEVAGRAHPACA